MDAREVVSMLGGRWHGTYGACLCPAHADRSDPSLSVRDGERSVLVTCYAGCTRQSVIAALRAMGVMPGREGGNVIPFPRKEKIQAGQADASRAAMKAIWQATWPAADSLVEVYLRARCVWPGAVTADVRFAPSLRHPSGASYPAMVCAVRDVSGRITGLHRTWLRRDGGGKADVTPQKAMIGACAGGAVRLSPADGRVVIAEGIESAMAVMGMVGSVPVWAALSAPGIKALILPPSITVVTIAADGDEPGETAAEAAAARWKREGRDVVVYRLPRGKDPADIAMALRAHLVAVEPAQFVH